MYFGSDAASERIFCRAELMGMSDWATTTAGAAAKAAVRMERSILFFFF